MAVDSAALKKYIGQGEIYVNVKKPASGAPQGFLAPTGSEPETGIPLAPDGTTGATSVGLTNGPRTLEYKPEFKGVEVEQTNGEIAPRVTKETVTLKFKCAQATWQNLQTAIQTATKVTVAGTAGTPNKTVLTAGGLTFFDPVSVCLVSPIGSYTDTEATPKPHNLFEWVTLYEAMSVDGLKLDYKRNETRMVDVTFTGYADVTRTAGDQLFQIGQDEDPTVTP